MTVKARCYWCMKDEKRMSEWEQQSHYGVHRGKWMRLCNRCAGRRLRNPYNALLPMRKIGEAEHE